MATDYNYGPQYEGTDETGGTTGDASGLEMEGSGEVKEETTSGGEVSGGFWSHVWIVLVASAACWVRHLACPAIWFAFLPGRYTAFLYYRMRKESSFNGSAVGKDGEHGYLQWMPDNVSTYGITTGSAWSEGWAVVPYIADAASTFPAWLRLLIPGYSRLAACWLSHPALEGGSRLDSLLKEVSAEPTPPGFKLGNGTVYWLWRAGMFFLLDVWLLVGIALGVMWLAGRWVKRKVREVAT